MGARLKFWRRSRVPKKGSRDEPVKIAIKGGGRPTRLLPHVKMLLIPIKLFLSAG